MQYFLNESHVPRRVARIWKRGGGFFERVRKVQTTLTRIFIGLESVSHGLSENWDGISRKAREFKRFFRPKTGDLPKKKKKGLRRNWDRFFGQNPKLKRFFIPHHDIHFTTSTPNFLWGGCFQFFTKNRLQKHPKRAILHTSQANGGLEPAPPPGYATACTISNCNLLIDFFAFAVYTVVCKLIGTKRKMS